jgi:aspartyl-tRNA(Asn)/glutamyl-tRNA(Gln) amidotransferase subunit C
MKLDKTLVAQLETLARLEFSSDSHDKIISQLETTISYIDQLALVNTTGVQPANLFLSEGESQLREDREEPGLKQQDILGQAPDVAGQFFRVPRVIDREDER